MIPLECCGSWTMTTSRRRPPRSADSSPVGSNSKTDDRESVELTSAASPARPNRTHARYVGSYRYMRANSWTTTLVIIGFVFASSTAASMVSAFTIE